MAGGGGWGDNGDKLKKKTPVLPIAVLTFFLWLLSSI